MRTTFLASLLLIGAATSLGTDTSAAGSAASNPSKHCRLLSTVTYHDEWGPLFIENSYVCDLPPLKPHPHPHNPTRNSPVLPAKPYPRPTKTRTKPKPQRQHPPRPIPPTTQGGHLPSDKHQIISYGCAPLPHASPLDQEKTSSLLYSISQMTNQSCIPPGHLKEYKEYRLRWSAEWAFTNFNRGEDEICDWYWELAQVANALDSYCENSLEREIVGGRLAEVFAYGRDRERESLGGQIWCLRYSGRGWGEESFGEKCLGIGLQTKDAVVVDEL